jgi:hypothetical protein
MIAAVLPFIGLSAKIQIWESGRTASQFSTSAGRLSKTVPLRLWDALIVFMAIVAVEHGWLVHLVAESAGNFSQVRLMRIDVAD